MNTTRQTPARLTSSDYTDLADRTMRSVATHLGHAELRIASNRDVELEFTLEFIRVGCQDRFRLVARVSQITDAGAYLFLYEGWDDSIGAGILVSWSAFQFSYQFDGSFNCRHTGHGKDNEIYDLCLPDTLTVDLPGYNGAHPSLVSDIVDTVNGYIEQSDLA